MDDLTVDLDRQSYPPVGRCIYCGYSGGTRGLRKEHIIPYALGGNAVILEASCADCEAVTSYLEGYVGRDIFGVFRAFYELQKRKRKTAQSITMVFERETGKKAREVLVKDAPPLLFMREFEPPGILVERLRHGPPALKTTGWMWYSHEFIERAEQLREPGDLSWSVPFPFKEDVFGRFLAKVAHCMVIAHFGIDHFRAYLPPLILGEDKNIGWLVGGAEGPTEAVADLPKGRHSIFGHTLGMGLFQHTGTKHTMLYADIRLFSFAGSPSYRVTVGEPDATIVERLA
jgi:hypothetical protein